LSKAFVGSGKKDWQWISADGNGVSPARSQIPVAGAQRLAHEFRLRTETGLVTSAGLISAQVVTVDAANDLSRFAGSRRKVVRELEFKLQLVRKAQRTG